MAKIVTHFSFTFILMYQMANFFHETEKSYDCKCERTLNKQTNRQTNNQTDKQTDKHTDKQI